VSLGFVVDELARGNGLPQYFGVPLSESFFQCCTIHSPVSGVTKTLLSCADGVARASWPLTCRRLPCQRPRFEVFSEEGRRDLQQDEQRHRTANTEHRTELRLPTVG
jgi:hypothetical protein